MNTSRQILFVFLCSITVAAAGCSTTQSTTPPRPAVINHLAFFKLQNPADAAELIADCDTKLATIPGVTSYYAGTHLDTGRSTVDGDYDVGFFVGFDNESDYRNYVEHPDHVAVVQKWKPRWEWIRVHDVSDETP